jgi:hypothetical protein
MKSLKYALVCVLAAAACGGQELGANSGGADGGEEVGASDGPAFDGVPTACGTTDASTGDENNDLADATTTTSDAEEGVTCKMTSSSVGYSSGVCTALVSEVCNDSNFYEAKCTCPAATCSCTATNGSTGVGTGYEGAYGGCAVTCGSDVEPTTAANDAWEACGYPVP